jgi:hypothetical protein
VTRFATQSQTTEGWIFCQLVTVTLLFFFCILFSTSFKVAVFVTQFLAFLGHVLLVERIAATILALRYERSTSRIFSVCWFTLLVRLYLQIYPLSFLYFMDEKLYLTS